MAVNGMQPDEAIAAEELIPLLVEYRDASGQPTLSSIYTIAKIGGPKAKDVVPWLHGILKDDSLKHLHKSAASALLIIDGHSDAIQALLPPNGRQDNTAAVFYHAGPLAIEAAPNLREWILDHRDFTYAFTLLHVSEEREAVAMLALMLRVWESELFPNLDDEAIVELAKLGGITPSWFKVVLISALASDDQKMRMQAAYALAELGESERVVPMLVSELEKPWAQRDALGVLEGIGQPGKAAIPSVEKLLNSSSLDMRRAARRTLQKLRGTED